ncbi:TPA: hypothetical protein HH295_06450 [Xanthomonas vasicola pv. zeae]|uniref:Uncharacterized protein n=2 Tax=Xanthomonas vasicola pv. vasculorum TaxID=325776 RepID=A0A836ZT64_XANVA|nr:DUF6587 family protein [Xanthomonas vasicola]MBV6747126.1 hypothetical protein [Xanthomonas vasicola pv. vasculorum NCPPB 890]AVQ07338.1 hypothetical protein C7V42_12690 [Xanthomonas vasicola pv. vasculorum]AZM71539.1 hypothetical protein CXP37_12700 [Xanthomonas vasicola pv. vasculorum]AZR27448.1 hypothetical protein NX80_014345 [Xanthomonas vasicola pv. arecae]AZR30759.1 hypothetical protein KWO_009670 [Xanthomonas vasicola pv. musacearum NCPPB 4379]
MTLSLALQYLVIAIAVLVSLWVVMKKQFPGVLHRLRGALALGLLRSGRPAWMRMIGRRVAPPATQNASACGGCDSCGPTPPRRH